MGMMSRAMKTRKQKMLDELNPYDDGEDFNRSQAEFGRRLKEDLNGSKTRVTTVLIDTELWGKIRKVADERGIDPHQLVQIRMQAYITSLERGKVLSLSDPMPYGQYRGILIEDVIKVDPRYVSWLASTSDIFVLDEDATNLLVELSL